MYTIATLIWMFGYGVGYEGYEDGKLYIGIYTPQVEYGYILTKEEIYLDTVFTRQ